MLSPDFPDLAALQVLALVGEEGSLSRAAARLGVSQQAVSARMRALERQLDSSLLVRSARGSKLTDAGKVIAGWAGELLAAAEALEAGIASIRSEARRQLEVAASLTVAEHLMPHWLLLLRTRQENDGLEPTAVGLTVTNSDRVIELVRTGAVAIGFIETPVVPSGLRVLRIGYDELQVAVAPDHPWARRKHPIGADELAATPLVTRERGSGTRQALEYLLTHRERGGGRGRGGIASRDADTAEELTLAIAPPRVELSSNAAVRAAIVAGTAPGGLSSLALADDVQLGRLVTVATTGIALRRQLSAVWRSGEYPPRGPASELVAIAAAR